MNQRKGQNLSMNVIIIAAIALLVLVLLAVLLFRSGGKVNDANLCDGPVYSGICTMKQPGVGSSCGQGMIAVPSATGCGENEVCCTQIS